MNDEFDDDALSAEEARLLAALGRVLGSEPLPAGLVERAEELLTLKDLDAELVELLDQPSSEPAGVRGSATRTRLEFEAADGSLALELVVERDRLVGQVLAGELAEVALERTTGVAATTTVDELGRFSFGQITAGPVRLRLTGGAAAPVTTDWFLV